MNDVVRSAARVLDLLEYFAEATDSSSLAKVATTFKMPKSSALGLLRTLQVRGYLVKDAHGSYRINETFKARGFGWGGDTLAHLIAMAEPVLDELSEALGETVILGDLTSDGTVRIVLQSRSTQAVRYEASQGMTVPAHCTAMGRVLLAHLPRAERDSVLAKQPLQRFTPETIVEPKALHHVIDLAREKGYCTIVDEFDRGATGIAMAILDAKGRPVAAMNVACISARIAGRHEQIIAALRTEVDKLGAALGPA